MINIFALAAHGRGISGGDRIFIEFARRWSRQIPVKIYVSEEGREMCRRQHLEDPVEFEVKPEKSYLARIIKGIWLGLTLKPVENGNLIIYSASEFWMDSLPAFFLKLRFSKIKWVAAWYQTAPNPLKGFAEGAVHSRDRLRAFAYWLVQFPIKPLISKFADYVLVNNEAEKKQFPGKKVVIVLGAVDTKRIEKWKKENGRLPKIYDAVFQGRFHPQKGVLELVDIWKLVVYEKPDAKLVMIGDGPLMENVKVKIQKSKLNKNIILKGYLFDGEEKFRIFAQSRIVLHPAFFDSGGMASGEAMAFGLPCVGFNLESYKYYYPKGMEKVKTGDIKAFAEKILEFMENNDLYKRTSKDASSLINDKWSWEYRARQILSSVLE